MVITGIKTYPVWYSPRNMLLVKVETEAKPFEFYEMPHLHKSDGSHTNW